MKTLNRTVVLVCSMLASVALAANAGLIMRQTIKTDGNDKSAKGHDGVSTISVQGKCMRMDYNETKDPSVKKGDYMVCNDGESFYMVNTKEKQYMKFNFAMAGGMMSLMNMKFTDAKHEVISDEAGPRILGYPTRHIKTTMSYTMEMSILGMKTKNQILQEQEMWNTTKLDASAFETWAKNFVAMAGNKDMEDLMKSTSKNIKGVPLKTIMIMTTTDKNGKKSTSTTITEVSEIKEQSLPASLFALPADYKEFDLSKMGTQAEEGRNTAEEIEDGSSKPAPKIKKPSLSDMLKLLR